MDILPLECVWRSMGDGTVAHHSYTRYQRNMMKVLSAIEKRHPIPMAFLLIQNIKNF